MPLRERNGNWHYRFWLDNREYVGNTGLAGTERNKTAAMRVEAKARELVMTGRAHELKVQTRPFSEAAASFLTWADGEYREHPNSAKRLRTSFTNLSRFFAKTPVSAILRGHIKDFKAWRRQEHEVREVTIRHDLHALSKAFGYWIDHNWARENPVKSDDIPSDKEAVRMHVLSKAEEELYFGAVRHQALHDVGRLMLNQGCRPDEVLNLRVEDVDLEHFSLTIRAGKSSAARRTLRLTLESREILARRLMAASDWIFEGKRPGTRLVKLNGRHDEVIESIGLDFVMYDLRHTFATRAAESGMPVATLAAILGHGDLRSVMKYVHVRTEAMSAAMDEFDKRSGFRPVTIDKTRQSGQSAGMSREDLSDRKSN